MKKTQLILAAGLVLCAALPAAAQRSFASPEEGSKALADAVRTGEGKNVIAIFGEKSKPWIFTGDAVSDRADWTAFLAAYDKKNKLVKEGDAKATINVGDDDWPFPAPLVKAKDGKWAFDAETGREEVINRRVGRNELDTIQTLLAVVDAQREYATSDADGNGSTDYAKKFISTKGKKDGLYFETAAGAPQSPLGPLVGVAAKEGYPGTNPGGPYHGYQYRMLMSQGKDAAGGAYSYLVKDRMMGGFAVVAFPEKYGVSGVKTFVVNHDGVVYEKDLGAGTAAAAAAIKAYNPDKTWQKVQ
ncbi:DUF2950 domain-containing protein [Usitatibacter palustris]|uniref:DUF2950 domain-containing protein n=1 Tax=Usitatibacter palustris TaxID=2732487 RepID=A0A6M4HE84_9PROT|nr:DUF2950 domain-containing protein [Usitatibacter palustris]QJR16823.1 hypothetical protein DSM104440_03659 [Usitatibacter palustris]